MALVAGADMDCHIPAKTFLQKPFEFKIFVESFNRRKPDQSGSGEKLSGISGRPASGGSVVAGSSVIR